MNLLGSSRGRVALFALLYASEGAPIGFIWWALPTILRQSGVPVETITGLTAMLILPWAGKFLWAPLIDLGRNSRWGLRAWIITAQTIMGLALLPLAWLEPAAHLGWWRTLLLIHGFFAATQDVAIDALAINTVPAAERGRINGYMQAGMLAGRSLFGGGLLLLGSRLGTAGMIFALVAAIWGTLILVLLAREPAANHPSHTAREFLSALQHAFRRRSTWLGLAFALTGAAGFEAVGALAGPYLVDRGVPQETIGWFFGVLVVGAMVSGGVVGGRWADRAGPTRAVIGSVFWFSISIGSLATIDALNGPTWALLAALGSMYVGVGLFTASSYTLFMGLTDSRLGGTQFSTFMAATNGCESWSAAAGGRIVANSGYPTAFLILSAVSLLTLPLVRMLKPGSTKGHPADNPVREK